MSKPKEKPAENIDIKRGIPTLRIACKDCYFLKNAGAYRDDKGNLRPCEYFGTVGQAEPCKSFVPNTRLLSGHIGPLLNQLAHLPNPDIVISAFFSNRRLKTTGFKIGQLIYFHVLGEDYLNNYASGYIIGYVQDVLIVEGNEGHISQIKISSAFTEDDWQYKMGDLLTNNRINDKNGLRKILSTSKELRLTKYAPPMLTKKKTKKVAKKTVKPEKMPKVINLR